jgi:hypothetical protein
VGLETTPIGAAADAVSNADKVDDLTAAKMKSLKDLLGEDTDILTEKYRDSSSSSKIPWLPMPAP